MRERELLRTTVIESLITPAELACRYPLSDAVITTVSQTRARLEAILNAQDQRLLVVVGPCSIHDSTAALMYAKQLNILRHRYRQRLEIVMRAYFEKPRTVLGWKGLISEPDLDGRLQINKGIQMARHLLLQINQLGLPTATEFLDSFVGPCIADLVSWGAIGARTTESQLHRAIASALICPIGFKNSTEGNFHVAIDAVRAARAPQTLLTQNQQGQTMVYRTAGNPLGHVILRGGRIPNYHVDSITAVCQALQRVDLPERIMVDFSHGNCQSNYQQQLTVGADITAQIRAGSPAIVGVMIESFLIAGCQKVIAGKPLVQGQSITDPCLGWQDTERLLELLAQAVDSRF